MSSNSSLSRRRRYNGRPFAAPDAPPAAEKVHVLFRDRYRAQPEPREQTLGDECARTSTLAAAGLAVGTAIAFVIDPPGTAAILRDAIQWWTLW